MTADEDSDALIARLKAKGAELKADARKNLRAAVVTDPLDRAQKAWDAGLNHYVLRTTWIAQDDDPFIYEELLDAVAEIGWSLHTWAIRPGSGVGLAGSVPSMVALFARPLQESEPSEASHPGRV